MHKTLQGCAFFCVISAIFGTNRAFIVQNSVKLCSIREKLRLFCTNILKLRFFIKKYYKILQYQKIVVILHKISKTK